MGIPQKSSALDFGTNCKYLQLGPSFQPFGALAYGPTTTCFASMAQATCAAVG